MSPDVIALLAMLAIGVFVGMRPLHAIEYQGGAHFKGAQATAARDAVKKGTGECRRRAGIGYVEVVAGDTSAELRRVVERLVRK